MTMTNKINVQPGSMQAPAQFRITVDPEGPYLVYGAPPLAQQFFVENDLGEMWYYQQGDSYPTLNQPTALCRCGHTGRTPYCDGSHTDCPWDPSLTAPERPLLSDIETYKGQTVDLTDNEAYCAFARFCDAKGQVWRLVKKTDNEHARQWVIRMANRCPAGRLSAWDKDTGEPFEPHYEPGLGLVEDPAIGCSGPLWVRGGIPVQRADGYTYEIRNRVTLCRCGESSNKPFCDGAHASVKYRDGLNDAPSGERY